MDLITKILMDFNPMFHSKNPDAILLHPEKTKELERLLKISTKIYKKKDGSWLFLGIKIVFSNDIKEEDIFYCF